MRISLYKLIKQKYINNKLKLLSQIIADGLVDNLTDLEKDFFQKHLDLFQKFNPEKYNPPNETGLKILRFANNEMVSLLAESIDKAIENNDEKSCSAYEQLILTTMSIAYYAHCLAMSELIGDNGKCN